MSSCGSHSPSHVLLLGATGTIGRATVDALLARGHEVTCVCRPAASGGDPRRGLPHAVRLRHDSPAAAIRDLRPDALVSCMASRTGAPEDARAVDHLAHAEAFAAAREVGVGHVVLLSAICVQKPRLAFQQAKLAAESALIASGLRYSIVRPTAFFKSLSGQLDRLRAGKPFLLFGDGRLTACKPISDADLAAYLAECLTEPDRHDRILPIGGPGPAMTPRAQGEEMFRLLGRAPRFRHVPVALLDAIIGGLDLAGRLSPSLRAKAQLARIGRYYATESMLVLDPETGRYDADATPETGQDRLAEFHARLIRGEATLDRGDHAVF